MATYNGMEFNEKQMKEIKEGLDSEINVAKYANPIFHEDQMEQIKMGLQDGLNVDVYCDYNYSTEKMNVARNLLFEGISSDLVKESLDKLDEVQMSVYLNLMDNIEIKDEYVKILNKDLTYEEMEVTRQGITWNVTEIEENPKLLEKIEFISQSGISADEMKDMYSFLENYPNANINEDFLKNVSENIELESLKIETKNFLENEYDKENYTMEEFNEENPDLTQVDIAYTTTEDGEHEIEVKVDLINHALNQYLDGELVETLSYSNVDDMIDDIRSYEFDEIVAIDEDKFLSKNETNYKAGVEVKQEQQQDQSKGWGARASQKSGLGHGE